MRFEYLCVLRVNGESRADERVKGVEADEADASGGGAHGWCWSRLVRMLKLVQQRPSAVACPVT